MNDLKYEKLKELMQVNWNEFTMCADKIHIEKLDYQILLGFLESKDRAVRDGASYLLNKITTDMLDCQVLVKFLKSTNFSVRDGASLLLMKHFSSRIDRSVLLKFLESGNKKVTDQAKQLLDNITLEKNQRLSSDILKMFE